MTRRTPRRPWSRVRAPLSFASGKIAGVRPAWILVGLLTTVAAAAPAGTDPAPDTIAALQSVANDSLPLAGRVVYLDFWASWCVPCRKSFPWMQTLVEKYHRSGLEIVTVNLDHDPAAGRKFMKEMHSTLPVVFDSTGVLAKRFNLEVMPTSFIYGRDGKLKTRHAGFYPKDSDDVEAQIHTLLQEKPTQ